MICPYCGAFFCNDTDELKTYCSKECRTEHRRQEHQRRHRNNRAHRKKRAARCCWRKRQYKDEAEALGRVQPLDAPPLSAYRCMDCLQWHLTSLSAPQ